MADTKRTKSQQQPEFFEWTDEQIKKANEEHYYVRVNGKSRGKPLLITGAVGRWKKKTNESDIYLPTIRLIGPKKNLVETLKKNGYEQSKIDQLIKEGYEKDNITSTKKALFEEEVKRYKEYKKLPKPKSDDDEEKRARDNIRITDIVNSLPPVSSKKKTSFNRDQIVLQKYKSLNEGSVLDVSAMKTDGSDIKVRKLDTLKNKYVVGNIPVASSSVEKYESALNSLNFPKDEIEKLVKEFMEIQKKKQDTPKKKKTATTTASTATPASTTTTTTTSEPQPKEEEVKKTVNEPQPSPEPEVVKQEVAPTPSVSSTKRDELAKNVRNNLNRGKLTRRSPKK